MKRAGYCTGLALCPWALPLPLPWALRLARRLPTSSNRVPGAPNPRHRHVAGVYALRNQMPRVLLTFAAVAGVAGQLRAPLTCGASGPSYFVTLDGAALLPAGSPLRVYSGGWVATWALLRAANASGSDGLGAYTGVDCLYARGDDPAAAPFISTSLYEYASAAASPSSSLLRFRYAFPGGAAATNFSAVKGHKATISNFPAFAGGPAPLLPRTITWQDSFVAPQKGNVAYGMAGGPLLSHGDDVAGRVTIFSPLDQFLTSSLGDDPGGGGALCGDGATGCFTAGAACTVEALPPGFAQSWLLLADSGITNTVAAWGAVLRAEYGATSPNLADASLTTLGYQTDNGAQLCFGCPGQVRRRCRARRRPHPARLTPPAPPTRTRTPFFPPAGPLGRVDPRKLAAAGALPHQDEALHGVLGQLPPARVRAARGGLPCGGAAAAVGGAAAAAAACGRGAHAAGRHRGARGGGAVPPPRRAAPGGVRGAGGGRPARAAAARVRVERRAARGAGAPCGAGV